MLETQMIKQLQTMTHLLGALCLLSAPAFASENSVLPIIGGTNVSASHVIAKRTVGLFFMETDGKQGLCTGSILDNAHILTAAHCVTNFKAGLVIFSNANMLDQVKQAAQHGVATAPKVRLMSSAVAKPGYDGQLGGAAEFNDLAIVTFSGGLAAGYEPAKFLSQSDVLNALKENAPIVLAGYGITSPPSNTPNQADPNQGSGTLRQVGVKFAGMSAKLVDIFVAGSTGHDACSGDSGGPAMVQVSGETYVIGVASRSDCRTTSIYTLVGQENATISNSFEMALQ